MLIRKEVHALGAGLLETALAREGAKGCSPVLCTEPVALEPPYARFDTDAVLTLQPPAPPLAQPTPGQWLTYDVYPAEEDLLSITWMETALRALGVLRGPLALELYGAAGRVVVRVAVLEDEMVGLSTALLGHFPALVLRAVSAPFPSAPPVAVNELCSVGPYHRTLSLLGKEGASPLSLAATVLASLREGEAGVLQVLAQPASPAHDWHYNLVNLVEAERRAVEFAQLGGLSRQFSYDCELPPLLGARAAEKVGVDVAWYATLARYAVWGTLYSSQILGPGCSAKTTTARSAARSTNALAPSYAGLGTRSTRIPSRGIRGQRSTTTAKSLNTSAGSQKSSSVPPG